MSEPDTLAPGLDATPICVGDNTLDSGHGYAKLHRQNTHGCRVGGVGLSNRNNLLGGQLGAADSLASGRSLFAVSVGSVVAISSEEQVLGVAALGSVAGVADLKSAGRFAISKFIGDAVSFEHLLTSQFPAANLPVPVPVSGSHPEAASRFRTWSNKTLKSNRQRCLMPRLAAGRGAKPSPTSNLGRARTVLAAAS